MNIFELQDLSLSDPSSRSERKRRLDMLGNRSSTISSGSDITAVEPAYKVGRSISGLSQDEISPLPPHSPRFLPQCKPPGGDGMPVRRKTHQCSAIISDAEVQNDPGTVCKINCHLGDIVQYQYPSVPSNRIRASCINTGRNCLDVSIKDISRNGITCIELLYRGVYSNIFVGYNNQSHKYVAVKLTNKGDHFCKRPLRNFNPCYEHPHNNEEINNLKQLQHPNIIKFIDELETKSKKNAIILEFCSNGPITKVIEKTKTMTESVALKYFKQMFQAVHFIHEHDYAVRNISLQHFLLDDYNQVKLIDLSKLVPLNERRTDMYGIAGFQAPEVMHCRQSTHHPGKVDLWSLGACLYTMVTGIPTTIHHSLAKSYKHAFKYPSCVALDTSCLELLSGMLEFLPDHRFTLNRVEYSEWFQRPTDNLVISGFHMLKQPRKLRLGLNEIMMRDYMEV